MVKTRFAPSPTGYLHSGNYRTAVFSYLFAKKQGGSFILRIEDTDRERSKAEYEENIMESLKWLGLPWDSFARQSESAGLHRTYLEKLIEEGKAYISKETPREEGERAEVIRFRNPGGLISFTDAIRGTITTDVTDLGDFVIAKSLDEPVFHLAVVVDDFESGVTHVVRGEDHISNTPRQILIQHAIGATTPVYAHLPLILAPDRTKLSKRRGAKALTEYRDAGILPEAMLNYLALLGWNPGTDEEYLSLAQLEEAFSLERVQKSPAIFDETKLFSVNQHWMRKLSDEKFIEYIECLDFVNPESAEGFTKSLNSGILEKALPLLRERAKTFGEAREMLTGELACLFSAPEPDKTGLQAKEPAEGKGLTKGHLEAIQGLVEGLIDLSTQDAVKAVLMPYADNVPKEQGGRGAVLWPLRYALSGAERSPDPFTLIHILGKEESTARIAKAIAILS